VIFDPPYATTTPRAGKEDGAAGTVSGPLSFLHRTMALSARALMPGGIVIVFGDYQRLPDLMYAATTSGLRPSACVAWVRSRPGLGGLLRASWDPVLVVSRGTPDTVSRAAVRNVIVTEISSDVIEADYELPRPHPYSKPPVVYAHLLRRVCRRGDVVLDPFAGSGSSRVAAEKLGLDLVWRGCDIDPAFAEEERHDGTQSRLQPEPGLAARSLPGVRAQGGCTRAPRIPWARSSA
jgi:DNA modification methylase